MTKAIKTIGALLLVAGLSSTGAAHADPDCAGPDHWVANMVHAQLKNAGVVSNDQIDFPHVTSVMLVSQKIGPDLYKQAFLVTFPLKSGGEERAIAVSNASDEECSMSDIAVYRLAKTPR